MTHSNGLFQGVSSALTSLQKLVFGCKRFFMLGGAVAMALFGVVACTSAPSIQTYALEKPVLDLKAYLTGNLTAHGVFTDRSGAVVKRFIVKMKGSWSGNQGVLDEQFTYLENNPSEKTSVRIWSLTQGENGQFTGTAADVIGQARGQQLGNAFNWQYTLNLPVGDKTYQVQFDDWMYLVDDKVMLNKARMSKWGIYLGEVTLVFNKE